MTGATTQGGTLQLVATATGSTLAAFNQHQMKADPARGNTRMGTDRLTPAVVHDNMRDWMASRHAGFLRDDLPNLLKTCPGLRGSGLSHSHWSRLSSRTATNCGVSRTMHALPRIHSSRYRACKPFARHTLPVKQLSQSLAYRNHHQTLSSSLVFAGINLARTDFRNGQASFAPGAKAND